MEGDFSTLMELQFKQRDRKVKIKLETIEIRKEVEWQGKKLIFYTFEENGIRKYSVSTVEKDAETGFWYPADFNTSSLPDDAKSLKQSIDAWESDGTLK